MNHTRPITSIFVKPLILSLIIAMTYLAQSSRATVFPRPLVPGDKIAILAPAGPIDSALVVEASDTIAALGFEPVIYPTSFGKNGHFSGTDHERFADLRDAFADPAVRAILCARGGYGAALILDSLAPLPIENDPKWLIGFSDISALHALMASKGIASIHASMAKQLALGAEDPYNIMLLDILRGKMPRYSFEPSVHNHLGRAEGRLLGGNLAVIQALINTPYDIIQPGTILFIEDVSEPIYKIERIIYQLRMAGIIPNLKGLLIGQFTDYKSDDNYETMEDMIANALTDFPDLPVAFNIPVGHGDENVPLVEGSHAVLEITPHAVSLSLSEQ